MTPVIARFFEGTVYHHYSKKVFEGNLAGTQYLFVYGGLLLYGHLDSNTCTVSYLKALDDKDCNYVSFCNRFLRAFDNVKHSLAETLKALHLDPYVVNWYLTACKES